MKLKKPFTIVLVGLSGSGKGTQAELLRPYVRPVQFVQTGKLLRKLTAGHSALARKTKAVITRGDLVPSWLAVHMWSEEMVKKLKAGENLLLDGSPRKKIEAEALDERLRWLGRPLSVALYISLSAGEARRRLRGRGRTDDTPAGIANRLKFFKKDVVSTLVYYRRNRRLITINGEQNIPDVFRDIKKALGIS